MANQLVGRTAHFLLLLVAAAIVFAPAALADETTPADTEEKKEEASEEEKAEPAFPWERDWKKATERAKAEGKDLFVNFTGSDWCGWCIKLDKEVFTQGDFAEKAGKHFVFVFLDFPNAPELKEKVVDPELATELKEKYGVRGFPSILLVNAAGEAWAKTGYQAGGPESYLKHLEEMRANKDAILGMDKEKVDVDALKAGIEALKANRLLENPSFEWIYDKARELDPDGKHGVRIYADRVDEKAAFKAVLPKQRGEAPNWEKIYEFIQGAKYMDDDRVFLDVSIAVVQRFLLAEKRFDDATALAKRIKETKIVQNNERALQYLDDLIAKIASEKEAAEKADEEEETEDDEKSDDDDGKTDKDGEGDDKDK